VLVLDDYHVIDARDVQDGMGFLPGPPAPADTPGNSQPRGPAAAAGRLRGRGELAEIRAADLRFTPGEATAYLNEVMGLALTAADIPTSAAAEISRR